MPPPGFANWNLLSPCTEQFLVVFLIIGQSLRACLQRQLKTWTHGFVGFKLANAPLEPQDALKHSNPMEHDIIRS